MNWLNLPQPIIALAAMDGVTDTVFRQICHSWGADLAFTEFIHSTGLIRSKKYRDPILKYVESERPVIVQIYGNNPEDFYTAAKFVLELGFDGIDINMGCPSKSVAGHGSGCALMRKPELASEIVKNVLKARDEFVSNHTTMQLSNSPTNIIPVTVKMRIGYDEIIGPDFAKVLEDAGAEGLIVHGRTLKMGYSGLADWSVIGEVAKSVKIPVIGNGDVKSADDIKKALDLGCAGVTIGRASMGNPFVFYEIKKELGLDVSEIEKRFGISSPEDLKLNFRINTYLNQIKIAQDTFGEKGFIESRKHVSGYVHSFPNASELRHQLVFAKSIEEVEGICEGVKG